jgi:hypothetical protein
MKKAKTIVAIVLVVGALVGAWFVTRQTRGVSTTTSSVSSPPAPAVAAPADVSSVPNRSVESPAPANRARPVDGHPRDRASASPPDAVARTSEKEPSSSVAREPRPDASTEPAQPPIRIDPAPTRAVTPAAPVEPERVPEAPAPEPPRSPATPPPLTEPALAARTRNWKWPRSTRFCSATSRCTIGSTRIWRQRFGREWIRGRWREFLPGSNSRTSSSTAVRLFSTNHERRPNAPDGSAMCHESGTPPSTRNVMRGPSSSSALAERGGFFR